MNIEKLADYVEKTMAGGDNVSIHLPGITSMEIVKLRKRFASVRRTFMGYVEFRRAAIAKSEGRS